MALGSVLPWLYMGFFLLVGWRLYLVGWPLWANVATAIAMVGVPPLLVLLPTLRNPTEVSASILQATALAMVLMGGLCLIGGVVATGLKQRARRP